MVVIKGWQKSSLIDFPPYTASAVFLAGCSFRCGFCHNPLLVKSFVEIETIPEKEVLEYIESKKKWIDALVITGGEPTLHIDLPDFISKIKEMGLLVKLDTNGSNPLMLAEVVDNVDYIAMDVKSSLEKYKSVCNVEVNTDLIQESALIVQRCKDYEFRTTVVPGLVAAADIENIGKWLSGSRKYVLQQFRNSREMIDGSFMKLLPYSKGELENMASIAKKYFNKVEVRV